MADVGIIKFQLANTQFGIFTDHILEIVRLEKFRVIPRPLPYVVGVMELRNYIVTIADLRKRLGLTPLPLHPGTTMIVGKYSTGMIGVLVESISHFRQVSEKDILPPFAIAGFPADLLHGVVAEEDEILLIPDLERLFSSYMRVQLLPISLSEKIAFHYRDVPGGMTRTLETVLALQRHLDEGMIRKMSHAMSLPPVQTHKISSYYADFHPQTLKEGSGGEAGSYLYQDARAGDESYVSLSKRASSQRSRHSDEQRALKSRESSSETAAVRITRERSLAEILEATLHRDADSGLMKDGTHAVSAEELLSQREVGRLAAAALRVAPVRLRKYLTYYRQSAASAPLQPEELHEKTPPETDREAELFARLQGDARSRLPLEEVLQRLHDHHDVLTRRHLSWLSEQYHISLLNLARRLGYYRHIGLDMREAAAPASGAEATRLPQQARPSEHAPDAERSAVTQPFSPMTLPEWMREVINTESRASAAFRTIAARLRMPTCRLHKLHTYYQSKEPTTLER